MHLFSFENEEDKETSINKFESLYCPMSRITTICYAEKWKNLPKTAEHKLVIGKLYTNKETNVIKRLQAHNIIACTFKTVDKTTIIYLACTTRDNIVILTEFTLVNSDFLYGKINYKTENLLRDVEFENFMTLILSSCENNVEEETIGR